MNVKPIVDILYEKLEPYRERTEKALKKFQPFSDDRQLAKVMDYAIFSGGKRLRPSLVYMSAEINGKSGTIIDPIACSVEFLHTASLLLDDLPVMDNTATRRGLAAPHLAFGAHATILASHSFTSLAFQAVAESKLSDQQIRLIVSELAKAVGPNGMSLGQMQDLRGIKRAKRSSPLLVAEKKSAYLFAASTYAGAVAAGASQKACKNMRDFGLAFGKAFQILDDIKDSKCEDNPERNVNVVQLLGKKQTLKLLTSELKKAHNILAKTKGHGLLEELLEAIYKMACHELSESRLS